jgi:hypothetical protein
MPWIALHRQQTSLGMVTSRLALPNLPLSFFPEAKIARCRISR